jgi:2-polyprenyl-6-methoxyphenol hydroxylase-like FAD-dependent oxidoreductase
MRKIAIIGCGFAGLSTALFLAKRDNAHITLFDKFEEVKVLGAGILMQPSSMQVLKHETLGLYNKLVEKGEKIYALRGVTHYRKEVFTTLYDDYEKGAFGIGIHRSVLFNDLFEKCEQTENITFKLGQEIHDVHSIKKEYDLVIVANGSHSTLRGQLPITQKYRIYPYGCLWTTIEDEETSPSALSQFVKFSHEMFGILPSGTKDGKRSLSIFWSLPVKHKQSYKIEHCFKEMEKYIKHFPNFQNLMNKLTSAHYDFAVYADVWMNQFNHENIVVIGDAAHGMSPQLGQGANMAFLDAYYLDKFLDLENIESSLAQYSTYRQKHLKFYMQASRFLTPLFQSDWVIYGVLRDILFSISRRLSFSKKMSSQILSGRRMSWFKKKEITY